MYDGWMGELLTSDLYRRWTGRMTLDFAMTAVGVLLFAAIADLVVRVIVRMYRGRSWLELVRYVLGQPEWWQTWYPRRLRVRDSVWDRLPFSMKLLRSLVWVELIVLPTASILAFVVIPTFQSMFQSAGREIPLSVSIVAVAYQWALYLLPVTLGLLVWKVYAWKKTHDVPAAASLASLFNLKGSYWQGSPARAILRG